MFLNSDPCTQASKTVKFNRFIALTLSVNILILSIFTFTNTNQVIFTAICWAAILGYFITNETMLYVLAKKTLITEKICNRILIINAYNNSILFLLLSLCTGDSSYIFLCTLSVFQSLINKNKNTALTILGTAASLALAANITGWNQLAILSANSNPLLTKILAMITVLGILAYTVNIFSRIILHSYTKADFLHGMATTDALTGLINRREFNRRISEEFSRSKRHKHPLSLALFDIDFFKKVNDTHGHTAGDAILRELGGLIANKTRNSDIAARYGGEEFALILPDTNQTDAYELLERIRQIVEKEIFYKSVKPINVTISVGVAQVDISDSNPADFCERADKALYKAKEGGRNRVDNAPLGTPKINLAKYSAKKIV